MAVGDGSPTSGGAGDTIATEDTYTATRTGIQNVKVGVGKLRTGGPDQDGGDVRPGNPLAVFDSQNVDAAVLDMLTQIRDLLTGRLDIIPRPVQTLSAKVTSILAQNTSLQLLGTNTKRVTATIANDATSTTNLYVLLGTGSANSGQNGYTVVLVPGAYYEIPAGYTGPVQGTWTGSTGFANMTELS